MGLSAKEKFADLICLALFRGLEIRFEPDTAVVDSINMSVVKRSLSKRAFSSQRKVFSYEIACSKSPYSRLKLALEDAIHEVEDSVTKFETQH